MARRYLNRPGPPAEPGLGPLFWRRVFVPVYPRLPWRLRRAVIRALLAATAAPGRPGSQVVVHPSSEPDDPEEEGTRCPRRPSTRPRPEGAYVYNTDEKVFEDIKAKPGEKAFVFLHTVPYEGSVGLVNLLTATRLVRKGFDVHVVLYGRAC